MPASQQIREVDNEDYRYVLCKYFYRFTPYQGTLLPPGIYWETISHSRIPLLLHVTNLNIFSPVSFITVSRPFHLSPALESICKVSRVIHFVLLCTKFASDGIGWILMDGAICMQLVSSPMIRDTRYRAGFSLTPRRLKTDSLATRHLRMLETESFIKAF